MTEELKQKAINRIKENTPVLKDRSDTEVMAMCLVRVEDYIAGATENGIQWHNLRKDPNDLPKEDKTCLVVFHNKFSDSIVKDISRYSVRLKKWWFIHDLKDMEEDVIAWCEIPQFKE